MTAPIRELLRTAIQEKTAELARLKASLKALGEEPEVRADGRKDSWARGIAFTKWMAEQPIGIELTVKQVREQFGSSTLLGYNRWFLFTRIGKGRYRYDGLTHNVPRQAPLQGLIWAARQRHKAQAAAEGGAELPDGNPSEGSDTAAAG